ncbi:MAG: hypothetical protein ACOVQE_11150 [Chitinophagaceae bacterium]
MLLKSYLLSLKMPTILRIDAFGAAFTALITGFVFPFFLPNNGIPQNILFGLSAIAGLFCLLSIIVLLIQYSRLRWYILILSYLNYCYCGISFLTLLYFYDSADLLISIYFLLEILVISVLARIEYIKGMG